MNFDELISVDDQPEILSKLLVLIYLFGRKTDENRNASKNFFIFIYKFLDLIFVKMLLNSQLPKEVFIGKGTKFYHPFGIIVHPNVVIGKNVILRHQVTIGNSKSGELLSPVLSDNVEIGAGAKLLGDIFIGKGIIIGANAVVTKSFEQENSIIAGIPAKIIY